jgi:HAD superfamily hydrolase (TIGR01549 family)
MTIDFGNTLVRTDRASFGRVLEETADRLGRLRIIGDHPAFLQAWAEERDRQFREEVPKFREVDVAERAVRVLARLRGMPPPGETDQWDDATAGSHVDPGEVDAVVDAYSDAFIALMRPVDDARETLSRLADAGFALAILSNWPLAETVDRFAEAHDWLPHLRAIVVSQRVGTIKPHPAIFAAAEKQLGFDEGGAAGVILHVGDDWAADVVGAARVGWRTAFVRGRQGDTPLPTSEPGDGLLPAEDVRPDLVIDELGELPALVEVSATAADTGVVATVAPATGRG